MDFVVSALALVVVFVIWIWFHHVLKSGSRRKVQFPPGPYRFPIIGNILQLGPNPHRSLANLSKTYGPLMSLHLGSIYTVVVSSPEIAKQVLHKHDQVFSGRPIPVAVQSHGHHKVSVAYLPAGNKWRKLRKICREKMFSSQRLDASQRLRVEKLQKLYEYVNESSLRGRVVNVGEAAFVTSLNLITATLFSVDFTDFGSVDATLEFKESIEALGRVAGTPNLADFFPVFKMIDPQGIKREAEFYIGKLLAIIGEVIDQRLGLRGDSSSSSTSTKKSDLLEILLDMREGGDYELSLEDIKHLLLDLFAAGTESTSVTVEWAMTELLRNPEKMASLRNELTSVIGENKQVGESDIWKLPYLQSVIKETLRCHAPGPLLVPRKAEEEVQINSYTIPKNAQILVNVWAMGRDPSIWSNPNLFEPERFLNSKIDFKGQDFTLIPFGSGRRICPGLALADRMLHLMVASLIHHFDWKLEPGINEVDVGEKFGLAVRKVLPLKAIPIKV